jgi:hypothetical protein
VRRAWAASPSALFWFLVEAQCVEALLYRRVVASVERERLAPRPVSHSEAVGVQVASRGERLNYELLGRVLAERRRRVERGA